MFPHIVRALSSDSNVVHSYAAIAVERLLSMKVGERKVCPLIAGPRIWQLQVSENVPYLAQKQLQAQYHVLAGRRRGACC